jgi:DNA-binding transcriptional MerR regulator
MAEKIYYRIGEVAKKFSVATSLIRYWEQEFDFIKPRKNAKGRRYYTQQDVDRFALVYYLVKEKGLTIQGTKDYFEKHQGKKAVEKVDVLNTLKKTKNFLLEIRKSLQEELEKIDNEDMP